MGKLATSKFFIAVIIFGAVSLAAGLAKLGAAAPNEYPYRSWTAWAIDDFLSRKSPANVVFLGSSLVLVPLAGVDADYLNTKLDGSAHHTSVYFEKRFAEATGKNVSSYNFALPGEMPSDAYMITSFLLKGPHKPDVIVYGVGPRDFMDNLLPSPAATDPYRFLSRFGDVSPWAALMMPDWVERLSYEGGRALYLYGHRIDIADKLCRSLSSKVQTVASLPEPFSPDVMHELLPEYRPFELGKGQAFFRPSTPEDWSKFTDNLGEYRKRYKQLKMQTFNTQMRFFTETLAAARANGSHVVVVAMPITDLNRQLLPDQNWEKYRSSIQTIANQKGATFVDFNTDPTFVRSDFGDTVHLHSGGGKRWVDKLVAQISKDQSVLTALTPLTPRDNHADRTGIASKGGAQ